MEDPAKGAKLVCIDDEDAPDLEEGKIYTFKRAFDSLDTGARLWHTEEEALLSYYPDRFRPVEHPDRDTPLGTKLECIDAEGQETIKEGRVYTLKSTTAHKRILLEKEGGAYGYERFRVLEADEEETICGLPLDKFGYGEDPPESPEDPNHYQILDGTCEAIDLIEDRTGPHFSGYLEGNLIKYIMRWRRKNGVEDLKKARVYLNWLIEAEEQDDE